MGLPELNFAFETAAESVVSRSKQGVVALILRDAGLTPGVYTVSHTADIPAELGAGNTAYVKQALIGYLSLPSKVYLSVIGADGTVDDGLDQLSGLAYDYLAGPPDLTDEEGAALAEYIKTRREGNYTGKAVLPHVAANHEGVVNFTTDDIVVGKTTYDAAGYCARIAGILAGTPINCSATAAKLAEVTGVEKLDDKAQDAAIDGGQLIAYHDGRQIKLGRAVTSKSKLGTGESEALKKIKVVEAIDLIHYYAVTTVEDNYLGQCANTYDNKCLLVAALRSFLGQLEDNEVLEEGSSAAEIDLDATRSYLVSQGVDVTELSDDEIRKHTTGSYVFVKLSGTVLDAMEDFSIALSVTQ